MPHCPACPSHEGWLWSQISCHRSPRSGYLHLLPRLYYSRQEDCSYFFFLIDLPQNQVASEEHQRLARVYFAAKTFQLSELCFQNFISFKLSRGGVSFRLILSSFLLPSFLSFLQYFVFLLFIWRAFQGRRSFVLRGLLGRLILLS